MAVPYAPQLVYPANNESQDASRTIRFSWRFSDPDGAGQSLFDFRSRRTDGDAGVWSASDTISSPNTFHDKPAGTFTAGFAYEWQVRARANDASLVYSPWSSSGFFFAAKPVTDHTFTAPVPNATISSLVYTWSTPDQDAYQFLLTGPPLPGATTIYYDSGIVGDRLARTKFIPFGNLNPPIPAGTVVRASIRVLADGLWSLYASQNNPFEYTPPRVPTARLYIGERAVTIESVDPTPFGNHPRVVDHIVERRVVGTAAWKVVPPRPAQPFPPNGSSVDYSTASAQEYEYRLAAVGSTGAVAYSDPVSERWVAPENVPNAWPTFAEGFDAEPKNA